jgi:hypothetical protein
VREEIERMSGSSFQAFEDEYTMKLKKAFTGVTKEHKEMYQCYLRLTRKNEYWRRMLMVDILVAFCSKAKIPTRHIFHFLRQFENQVGQ